ncbi:MAG: pantoate--beta-alanine ligase [Calditrichaeota bacterium]|nr:pantoate--beta-alanine ligase [Calditrichota bacterium]
MKIVKSIREMQQLSDELRCQGKKIGFVPTMGYLHEGHLSLLREAKKRCDVLVMSIFVNPTQFGPNEDFAQYPRNFERDSRLAEKEGCDVIFSPDTEEMYPENYLTSVEVEEITNILCGASRPGHFRGVTTVVAKLFNAVKPHVAVFGQKDAQQAVVIKRMTRDLNFDIDIIIAPIVREHDGLAMSSRNTYLSPEEREQALVLNRSLKMAEELILSGERDAETVKQKMKDMINEQPDAKIDYVEILHPETLEFQSKIKSDVLIALAVKIGKTRLIDNLVVKVGR